MYYMTQCESPVGQITLASDGQNLVGLWLKGQKYFGDTVNEEMKTADDLDIFKATNNWLNRYFAGENPAISELALAPIGGTFGQEVWRLLCEIPYGEVTTYGEIARKVAEKLLKTNMSAQAVGGAVGHNPVSIVIPCHRVVGTNGSLTGYAGGVDKKIWLLTHEGVNVERFTVPTKGTAL